MVVSAAASTATARRVEEATKKSPSAHAEVPLSACEPSCMQLPGELRVSEVIHITREFALRLSEWFFQV